MKAKKLNKKLTLNKKTISNLSKEDMKVLGGYVITDYCTVFSPRCQGLSRDCPVESTPYNCQSVTDCNETCYATCGGDTCVPPC